MNINTINNLPTPQPQIEFKGKVPQEYIQFITEKKPFSTYAQEHVLPQFNEVIKMAKNYRKPIKVAQLTNEKLLVNVGNLSKVIDANKTPITEIPMVLSNLIKANAVAEEKGLKAGFSYLA